MITVEQERARCIACVKAKRNILVTAHTGKNGFNKDAALALQIMDDLLATISGEVAHNIGGEGVSPSTPS